MRPQYRTPVHLSFTLRLDMIRLGGELDSEAGHVQLAVGEACSSQAPTSNSALCFFDSHGVAELHRELQSFQFEVVV